MQLVGILCFLVSVTFHASRSESVGLVDYTVVLDGKGPETFLKLFGRQVVPSNAEEPGLQMLYMVPLSPGLGSFVDNVPGLTNYLGELIALAEYVVPEDQHATTPIYLWLSSGSRLLKLEELNFVLDTSREILSNDTINPFNFTSSNVKLVTGEEEGTCSWIAANFLQGSLDPLENIAEHIGVLDIDSGSTQITFVPKDVVYADKYAVPFLGNLYHVYVQSYLMYGADTIKVKLAHLLAEEAVGMEIENPCLLKGDTLDEILDDGKVWTQKGTSDPVRCLEILKKLLQPNTGIDCAPAPCAIGSAYQPSVANTSFIATNGFTSTPYLLKVVMDDNVLHLDLLEEAATEYCNQTLSEAVEEYGVEEVKASDHCLMGLYIPTLFNLSYGFPKNTTDIIVSGYTGLQLVDWTLGALLMEM